MSVPNIEKYLQYLQCFATHPIDFNGIIIGDQITEIKLNNTLFYTDSCQNCGGCCPAESNLYTRSEYEKIINYSESDMVEYGLDPKYLNMLKNSLHQFEFTVNGSKVEVFEFKKITNLMYLPTRGRIIKRCSWCFQDEDNKYKCRIHPVTSITCVMPHLRTYHVGGSHRASIGIHQFGRNWALKCPVNLIKPIDCMEFETNRQNVIKKLEHLNRAAMDLNIETCIESIIDSIYEQNFETFNGAVIPVNSKKQRKLFQIKE